MPGHQNRNAYLKTTTILNSFVPLLLSFAGGIAYECKAVDAVWLSSLDLSKMQQSWGRPQINRSIREKPLTIAGQLFERGVGTHATSALWIELGGGSEKFLANVGLDDAANGPGSVVFRIFCDGNKTWDSDVMRPGQSPKPIDLDLKGVHKLLLLVTDAGDGIAFDHADWAEAKFLVSGAKPQAIDGPREEAVILTPKPGPEPHINGPRVVGCRPTHPFLFRIPTTGLRPIRFSARNLPETLHLDAATGIISGTAPAAGVYELGLVAKNQAGRSSQRLKLVCGEVLALTPPMGWNHWYAHYDHITDELMRQAADAMVSSGMADAGYAYVDIDDCWMNAPTNSDPLRMGPLRDSQGNIIPNKYFPDMKELTSYIHSKGLKAGIYTSPGPLTCGGFCGSYQHEAQDARQFSEWGFDFLKYDWCSYGDVVKGEQGIEVLKKPYQLMGDLLRQQPRDIVFNLCQYGMGNVWEWGAEVGGHCWRTAGDLGMELHSIFPVALRNAKHRAYSKPGNWNDPDYIQIGYIGDGRGGTTPCPLTPNEQYAFMSLWCLMAAPLFYSGDMRRLDEFTLNVLCNPEVIEVDQDPLGQSARVISLADDAFLMVKDLQDGSKAVGLFNRGEMETTVAATWPNIGIRGRKVVRDLWREKDLGRFNGEFKATVGRHGGMLVRIR
jgi:alpha-galactosidase